MKQRSKSFQFPLLFLFAGLLLFSACQDPITLGADLVDEDQVNLGFTDSISVRSRTMIGDSVRTYAPQLINQLRSYLFGDFQDPIFGQAKSSVYVQVRPERFGPDFSNSVLDSIVLVLPYDTNGIYGAPENDLFGAEVFRLAEDMDRNQSYWSNQTFSVFPNAIGSSEFRPNLDSIEIIEYISVSVQDTVKYPHLRIHLDPDLGNEILNLDSTILQSDTAWLDYFKGLHLRPTQQTSSMLSFLLNAQPYRGGMYIYYTQDDTVRRQFQFEIDEFSTRFTSYEHDYSKVPLNDFIGDFEKGDSLLFVQGMQGVDVEIELLDDLEQYRDIVVNKAELIVHLHPQSNADTLLYPPGTQLLLSSRNEDGVQIVISDVELGFQSASGLVGSFGGVLNKQDGSFRMNISAYFQDLLRGDVSNVLLLTVFPKADSAKRLVLYGAKNPVKGISVSLAFSKF